MSNEYYSKIKERILYIDRDIGYHITEYNDKIKIKIQEIKKLLEQERERHP